MVLAAVCSFTLLGTIYLSLSLLMLQPPRASFTTWFVMAALFVAQSAVTLAVLAGRASSAVMRRAALAGGAAVAVVGALWIRATVTGPHFEGYAIVLGSAVVAQGALTLLVLSGTRRLRMAGQAPAS
jgi:hypothetical protein